MHEVVFYLAFAWMTVLLVVGVAAVIRLRSTASRILALDMTTLILVALLDLYADANRSPYFLDAALILSLLAFLATLALARYHCVLRIFKWRVPSPLWSPSWPTRWSFWASS